MLGKDIKNLVVVKMEEYTPYGPQSGVTLLAGGDSVEQMKPVESYIDQMLAEAANEMLLIAPIHHLVYKDADVVAIADEKDNRIGTIHVPKDFLRLHTLRMDGWTRPVHDTIHEGHPFYSLQFSRFTRGTKQKPIVTIEGVGDDKDEIDGTMYNENLMHLQSANVIDEEGYVRANLAVDGEGYAYFVNTLVVLHYYSVDASDIHKVRTFRYVPCFNEEMDYDRRVAELIALQCARKVYQVYGNTEQFNAMTNEINSVLENLRQ